MKLTSIRDVERDVSKIERGEEKIDPLRNYARSIRCGTIDSQWRL